MRYKNVTEIGSILYVRTAAIIDELYQSNLGPDASWLGERKRHHKRLWMRLMRKDTVFAQRTLDLLISDYAREPFDETYQRRLDHHITLYLFILIEAEAFGFDGGDRDDAVEIMDVIVRFLEGKAQQNSDNSVAA